MGSASSLCVSHTSMVKRQELLLLFACFAKLAEIMGFSRAAVPTIAGAQDHRKTEQKDSLMLSFGSLM